MPDMLDEARFRNEIKTQTDRELAESVALKVFFICDTCERHGKQLAEHTKSLSDHTTNIAELQKQDRKALTGAGALGSGVGLGLGVFFMGILKKLGVDF